MRRKPNHCSTSQYLAAALQQESVLRVNRSRLHVISPMLYKKNPLLHPCDTQRLGTNLWCRTGKKCAIEELRTIHKRPKTFGRRTTAQGTPVDVPAIERHLNMRMQ